MNTGATLSRSVRERIEKLGFTPPYIVDLNTYNENAAKKAMQGLKAYIDAGHHASMTWIEDTFTRRSHPQHLWEEANSAIMFGFNYGPQTSPLEDLKQTDKGNISVYARHRDYHNIMKGRLKEIAGLIARDHECSVKIFVDTAPLMEKPLAAQAGLGWQGKHTNLVSRDYGSWLFIGTIFTSKTLVSTRPEVDHCGSCRACLDICPTHAFPAPYKLDARRCISYLTIEHKGPIAEELRPALGNHIYGCDDCLAVCPWNKFAQTTAEIKLAAREDLSLPKLSDLANLDEAGFRKKFAGSPIKRIGFPRFMRNILYAIGNSQSAELSASVIPYLDSDDETLQDAAHWALSALGALGVDT